MKISAGPSAFLGLIGPDGLLISDGVAGWNSGNAELGGGHWFPSSQNVVSDAAGQHLSTMPRRRGVCSRAASTDSRV